MTFKDRLQEMTERIYRIVNTQYIGKDFKTARRADNIKIDAIKEALLWAYKKGQDDKENSLKPLLDAYAEYEDDNSDGTTN